MTTVIFPTFVGNETVWRLLLSCFYRTGLLQELYFVMFYVCDFAMNNSIINCVHECLLTATEH